MINQNIEWETLDIENKIIDEKLQAKKKRFWINTIELILWVFFLIISFQYIQTHPAEKNSVFSSVDSLFSKIHNLTGGLLWSDTDLDKQKDELVDIYQTLLTQITLRECGDDTLMNKVTVRLNQLQNLTAEQFSKQHSAFRNYAGIYADEIARECVKIEG